ncbi:MAG TPA: HIT domain-containing protein [Solirubrobacteraceae bacterium]|jgi:diadenosine tetraphosphate (Ap4A) HIT family hydrolase|nr:HIT domain-containing protein [Solirubrobacteraceae bacterium]
MTAVKPCHFCEQIAGSFEHNLLYDMLEHPWAVRPVLRENERAVAMPSIGALTPGHLLISPKQHLRSFAAASTAQRTDLDGLAELTARELHEATGLMVHGFEHGSAACGGRIACSIEHAHRHLIPCRDAVISGLREAAHWKPLGTSETLSEATDGREYLSYHDPCGRTWTATSDDGFPSQMLRRVFASALGNAQGWDWHSHPHTETVLATVALLDEHALAEVEKPSAVPTHTLVAA